jgi:hypothetical protein
MLKGWRNFFCFEDVFEFWSMMKTYKRMELAKEILMATEKAIEPNL